MGAIANPLLTEPTDGLHYLLVGITACVATWTAVHGMARGRRRSWTWLAAGLTSTVVGDLMWETQSRQGEVPFPAPADGPYLLGLAMMTVGGALFLVERHRQLTRRDAAHRRELGLATVASALALADHTAAVRAALRSAGAVVDDPDVEVELRLPDDLPSISPDREADATLRVDLTPDPDEGALVVRSPRPLPHPSRGALARLASDVTMALDRCRLVEELRASEQRFSSLAATRPTPSRCTTRAAD